MPRPRVYIAGPLTTGNRLANVQAAIAMARELIQAGYAPMTPHLSHFADPDDSLGYENWLEVDLAWVEVADAVLRLPGHSPGADREESHARKHGVPVCYGIRDLCSTMHGHPIATVWGPA